MPKRLITSDFFMNDKTEGMTDGGKLLYLGMITLADDEGRGKAKTSYLKAHVFPYDESKTEQTIKILREECLKHKLFIIYEVDGTEYYYFPTWKDHQNIRGDRFKQSQLPPPNDNHNSTNGQPNDNHQTTNLPSNQMTTNRQPNDTISQVKSSQVNISKDNIPPTPLEKIDKVLDKDLTDRLLTTLNTKLSAPNGKALVMAEISALYRHNGKKELGSTSFQVFYDALGKYPNETIARTVQKVLKYGEGKKSSANYIKTILDEKQ